MEKRNANCKFTILQENEIINEYLSGKSMYILGKNYNCDPSTIKNILRAYNIQSRSLSQARINYLGRTLNEDIFEKIDSCDKAYWLGVMYSDGYISKTNQYTNSFGISVNKKDKEWLEKFSNFLGYNGNINDYVSTSGYSKNTEYSRILIGNNKIVSDLEKLGVVEHKTKKINSLPKISDYLMKDFIRGYIDGDGSLRKEYPSIMICGNKEFLIEIGEFLHLNYRLYKDKSIYDIYFSRKESEYLEKVLYKDANTFLTRKYIIASRSFNSPITLEDVMKKPE